MPLVLGLLRAASVSPQSSFALVDLTTLASHVHCVVPDIVGTGFPDNRQQGTVLESQRHMPQGWDTPCVPIHRHISFPFLPFPLISVVLVTIPYTDGTAGRRQQTAASL